MATLDAWMDLTCNNCGISSSFIAVTKLRWRQGGGITLEPIGYECQQCRGIVATDLLVNSAKLKEKQRELKQVEEEMQAAQQAAQQKKAGVAPVGNKANATA